MKLIKKIKDKILKFESCEQRKPLEPKKSTQCHICSKDALMVFIGKVLGKYDVEYYYCYDCGHLQVQEPFWLDEAYESSITTSDTGIMQRNLMFCELVSKVIYKFFDKDAKFCDFAGGYGLFTRLMRDVGFDFYWSDMYSQNLIAKGFEYDGESKVELLCALEAIEHFKDPIKEFDKLFEISQNVIVSQNVLPCPIPNLDEWWYYGLEHGQHIRFYSKKTFEYLAKKYNKYLYSYKSLYLFSSKKINPLAFKLALMSDDFNKIKSKMKSKTFSDMNLIVSNTTGDKK